MGKLEKKDAPPTRGRNQNRSLLALAPPIPEEQRNRDLGPSKVAAASLKDDTSDKMKRIDKDHGKKRAARTRMAANPGNAKLPGVYHEAKADEEESFLAAKQRNSGGRAGQRGSRKNKSSGSEAFTPGAVLIPGNNVGLGATHSNEIADDDIDDDNKYDDDDDDIGIDVDDAGTFIVAAQVVNNDVDENLDGEKMETKIQQEVESRLKMHNQNLVVVDAVVAVRPSADDAKEDLDRKIFGLTRRVWCLIVFLAVLIIAIVTGVLVSSKSDSPAPIDLRTVILQTYDNTSAFDNPESPQAQALQWLLQDPYSLSQQNGTAKILERYALAVFYYSMDGSNWDDELSFLSGNDTCSWNDGLVRRGDEEQGIKGAHCESAVAVELLQFHEDGLNGTLPSELSLLTNLVFLNMTSDLIGGTIPTELGRLTNLARLNLRKTNLTGTLPTEIGALTDLAVLSVSECNLEGTLPTELGALTILTQLNVFSNSFSGTLPKELGELTSLKEFTAYSNNFVGPLPVELVQWTRLELLGVDDNRLTGTIPTEFESLTALLEMNVHSNMFKGTIPTELGLLTSLQHLDVSKNSFNGTLPTELGQLTNMTSFNVNSNSITGTLPTELGNLTVMTVFDVSVNRLTGTLPTELGAWNSLEDFFAFKNDLTGTLPAEFGAWNSVLDLSVYMNSLVGTVPTEFGRLGALMTLDISVNSLSGELPTELSQLGDLVQFSFYHNNFTGSVNDLLCSETREWDILEADCAIDGSGQVEVECPCCTACCNLNESACI